MYDGYGFGEGRELPIGERIRTVPAPRSVSGAREGTRSQIRAWMPS